MLICNMICAQRPQFVAQVRINHGIVIDSGKEIGKSTVSAEDLPSYREGSPGAVALDTTFL